MSKSIRLKDHRAEQELFEQRALVAAILMVLALGAVVARLVWLQVVRHDYYVGESQGNRIKVEPIPANRGAVAVVVENAPRGGSPFASPIARRIVDSYLLASSELAEQDAKRKPSKPAALPADRE